MLSLETTHILDASVPVLREHGVAITTRFYADMFAAHPELTNLFNMGNQKSGVQQQSLASALFAYAANYHNQAALAPVVSRIVQKHVSVGIVAAHYPIVGKHLLGAISHVLGDAATPELLAAWAEAYGDLAGVFITEEKAQYQAKNTAPGACRSVTVTNKISETPDVTSFYLKATDGQPLPSFLPGQYISVAMSVPALGLSQLRQYSLSSAPDQTTWRISVKRESGELAFNPETSATAVRHDPGMISNLLHTHINEGDTLAVGVPCGDFVLNPAPSSAPLVFISAGVGITPIMSMLLATLAHNPQRPIHFLHAARNGAHHVFRKELQQLAQTHAQCVLTTWYEHPQPEDRIGRDFSAEGRMDLSAATIQLPEDGQYYLCGPHPFMQQQRRTLLARGIAASRIQHEVFGPDLIGHLE